MASADDLAAMFASAWTAGAGARLSADHTARLASLWDDARRKHPDLDEREFIRALAELAPGADGLTSFFGNERVASSAAQAATLARGSVAVSDRPSERARRGTEDTIASGPERLGTDATMASGRDAASAPSGPRQAPERYRLIRQLGAGAMGVVWEAEDKQLHRKVALKWVTPAAAGDKAYRTRLFREARALAQLHHPNVLAVHDVGESGDEVFLALELIDGTTAREWMDAEPRPHAQLLGAWRQAGSGIAAVHAAGLVHRDIKPENVFISRDGRVVVGDFGLATGELGETVATNLTATGAVVGTPLYMAPEQLHGEPATPKGDQFSLCVCLWEALAGKRPFDSTSIAGLAVMMLKPPVVPQGVDRRVFAALQRGLSTEAADRWPDVNALLAAIDPGSPQRKHHAVAIGAAIAVGAVGAVVAMKAMSGSPPPTTPPVVAVASGTAPVVAPSVPPDAAAPAPAGSAAPDANVPITNQPPPPPHKTAERKAKHVADADADEGEAGTAARPTYSAWKLRFDDSINALQSGDGKRCLDDIKDRASWPATAYRELLSAEAALGACLMASGDCAAGHAAVQAFGATHHLTPGDVQRRIDEADARFCKLDDPPRSQWPTRAAKRLEKVAYAHQSCKVVQDFIAANHLTLPPNVTDPDYALERVNCFVAANQCEEARKLFLATRVTVHTPEYEQMALHSFELSWPGCVGS